MHEVELHQEADREMKEAATYYEQQVNGLGNEFLTEIDQALTRIRQFPFMWPVYEGEYRRCLLKRFPYGLIYRLAPETVFVMAVAHLHRKPGYWKDRQ